MYNHIQHFRNTLSGLFVVFIYSGFIFFSCNCRKTNVTDAVFNNYDTVFQIDQVVFPDQEFINDAIEQSGNQYRLKQFFTKAEKGQLLTIGFIGGSITEGSQADSIQGRYSTQFCRLLEKTFPKSDFIEINAGAGGTNSRFACSRVQSDLLDAKPDLIVVDFSVNDHIWDSVLSAKTYESLLRKCLQKDDVPVLIIHFTVENGTDFNQKRNSIIANHYKLPVINYQTAVMNQIKAGKIKWESVGFDGIHPNTQGHFLAAYLLQRFLADACVRKDNTSSVKEVLPLPLYSDFYVDAEMLSVQNIDKINITTNAGWTIKKDNRQRYGFYSDSNGASITFKVDIKELTICYLRNSQSPCKAEILIDGKVVDTLSGNSPFTYINTEYLQIFECSVKTAKSLTLRNLSDKKVDIPFLLFVE